MMDELKTRRHGTEKNVLALESGVETSA